MWLWPATRAEQGQSSAEGCLLLRTKAEIPFSPRDTQGKSRHGQLAGRSLPGFETMNVYGNLGHIFTSPSLCL